MELPTPFLTGVTYWPRRTGFRWWSAFDRGELREDMQRIAALGMTDVRFCLTWEDVQPAPRKINGDLLRLFERALDEAANVGLHIVVGLFPVAISGGLFVPRWAASPDPFNDLMQTGVVGGPQLDLPEQPPVIYEHTYRTNRARDLFRDSLAIEAQQYQIGEVVGYFGSHPAVRYWQLGEGLERVHTPASDDAVEQWYTTMVETARTAYSNARLLGVTSSEGLLNRAGPRPEQLAAACDLAGVALDAPLPLLGLRADSLDALEFTYQLVSSLAERPVAVVGLGLPTVPGNRAMTTDDVLYGRPATGVLASGRQQSEFLAAGMERLWQAGAPLVMLADYSDYPADLWRFAPLDQSVQARTRGLIDSQGGEKPAAESVQAVAQRSREQQHSGAARFIDIDAERYWRDPAMECERLWRAFMRERS